MRIAVRNHFTIVVPVFHQWLGEYMQIGWYRFAFVEHLLNALQRFAFRFRYGKVDENDAQ